MASWFIVQTSSFRVRPDGKGSQERKIDATNPLKSLEELETKVGLVCPDEKKKELLERLQTTQGFELPSWLQSVSIPAWYKDALPSDVQNALQWGCDLVQEQKRIGEHKLHDQLDLQWKRVVAEKQTELDEYKRLSDQQIAQKEKEAQMWQKKLFEAVSATGIESKIESLKQEWISDQKKLLETLDRERLTMVHQIEYLQTKTHQLEQVRETLQNKLEHRDSILNKSVLKGNIGEETVEGWFKQAFYGAANIENTSKESGKMDLHITWEGMRIMVDVKNHDGRLHSKHDVEKFHRNLHDNPEMNIGILLCTSSRVPNHNRFWVETEFINDKQLAIYMNHVAENPIERLQLIAGTILQPWKEYLHLRHKVSEMVAGDELRTWSDKARCTLLNSWSMMMRLQDQWTKTYDVIHGSLKTFQEALYAMAADLQDELRELNMAVEVPHKRKAAKLRG